MEDGVIQTTQPTSDVVVTANTSPENTTGYVQVQEPVVDSSQASAIVADQSTPPAPKTERELAYEEINRRQVDSYNSKGSNIKTWINNSYNYNPADAGTLWVAGKINDVNTQMSFLEATLNEDLYSEIDLQKYFFDTNLATARAYAKEKKHETAYGFYRAAQEKALVEGQLTGWYMPPEAHYMLSQWIVADQELKRNNLSDIDRARAESVRRATSGWFEANNITERGIECLNSLYLKETIRHNKENERLQQQSLDIQKQAAADNRANAAAANALELREFRFQTAEMEKDYGYDLDNNGVIGHTGVDKDLGFYTSTKEWAENNFDKAFKLWGSDHMRVVFGDDYRKAFNSYKFEVTSTAWFKEQINSENGYIAGENMDAFSSTKIKASELTKIGINNSTDVSDMTIKMLRTSDDKAALYVFNKHGVAYQITDANIQLADGKTVGDLLSKQDLSLDTTKRNSFTGTNSLGEKQTLSIGKLSAKNYKHSISVDNKNKFPGLSEKASKSIEDYTTNKGYKIEYGLIDTEWEDELFVLSTGEGEDKQYYAVDQNSGDVHKIKDTNKILNVTFSSDGATVKHLDGSDRTGWEKFGTTDTVYVELALKQSELLNDNISKEYGKDHAYAYTNNDGSIAYWVGESFDNGINDYSPTIDHYISESQAREYNKDITSLVESRQKYVNNVVDEVVKTKDVETMIKDNDGTAKGTEKKEIERNLQASVHDVNVTVPDIEEPTKSNSSSKTSGNEVLNSINEDDEEDKPKYVTPTYSEGIYTNLGTFTPTTNKNGGYA